MKIKIKLHNNGICLFQHNDSYSLYLENLKTYDSWTFMCFVKQPPKGRTINFKELPDYKCEVVVKGDEINRRVTRSVVMYDLNMECDYEISGILFNRNKNRRNFWKSLFRF